MPNETRNKVVHITIGTVVTMAFVIFALITGVLEFGRSAGNFEARVLASEEWIDEVKPDVKSIPILQTEIINAKDDRNQNKLSLKRIENLLLKRK